MLPTGGADGARLVEMLAEIDVPTLAVPLVDHTRSNLTLVEGTGVTTKINAPGPRLTPDEVDALLAALETQLADAARARWSCAGSLPLGAPETFFVQVARPGRPVRRAVRPRHLRARR